MKNTVKDSSNKNKVMPETESLGTSLIKTAVNPKLKDFTLDVSEAFLDSLFKDGVLRDVPVLKGFIALRKTWDSVSDYLLLRKVSAFLHNCPKLSQLESEAFIIEHWTGDKAKRLGELLLLLLDKLDDLDKPVMLAKVFAAFVRKNITYDVPLSPRARRGAIN